ncbi:MAG: TIGR00297 family protein [Methanocellales archaeon]|nr:TIGR00297 family protein [Methanocellales archaeon]
MEKEKHEGLLLVLFGCIALMLPFFREYQLTLIVLALTVGVLIKRKRPSRSLHLCFAVLTLAILSWVLHLPMYIVGASIAISVFGSFASSTVEQAHHIKTIPGSILFLIFGIISAFLVGSWTAAFSDPGETFYQFMFFLATIGAVTGALLKSIQHTTDNLTIPFGSAMAMWLFAGFEYWVSPPQVMLALALTLTIGYISYMVNTADITGVLSGTLLGVLIIIFGSVKWFTILLAFFVLGGVFTRYKYGYKESLGIAQAEGGARGYKNVFGNGLVALILAVAEGVWGWHVLLIAYLGAVATTTGDTLASEIGETSKTQPRMITSFERVKPGTSGAISPLGEVSALVGTILIGALAVLLGMTKLQMIVIAPILGGFIGVHVDSLLGATLENKGYLTNHSVNLLATASGAIVSMGLYYALV